ncbi:MAG: hypothetical protein K9L26_05080, partial [Candidatus Izimaplasma sp.]|nr:hypothetical protein [Candidatus Izimaplasma bacterium]
SKVVNKTQKQLENVTKKHREKALTTLKEMKLKFEKDLAHQNYLEALAQIEFEEAKILYKIKQDRDSLQQNMRISKDVFNELTTLLKSRKELGEKIAKKRFTLRLNELDIMKTYEISEYTERTFYSPLLQELYDITVKRFKHLANEVPSFERMKCYQRYYVELQTVQFDFYQKIHQIDHQILTKQNQSIIEIEKQKEEINSEIIYQESLVSIAKKENELQRIKVNALYENERSLAEEQADRIELGIKVNDTFVKSTLENQLLFATQQIECAKSEYDIRLENIALTQEQEMAYAKRKIDYYSQKYEYEITQLEKERDHKLEDLEFKRLLFTDKKDNQKIEQSIAKIKASYQEKISRIEEKRENDTDIMRYQKVIDETNKRAGEAIEEAEKLKSETVDAFQLLYDQTKEKYDKIKTTKQTEATEGIVPLLNTSAVSSANDRLQKATIEADTLYKERIEIPQQEIKRLKSQLFEITEDHETEQFIESLKEQKTDLVETLNAQKEALKEALTKELSTIEETSQTTPFTAPKMDSPVRTEAMIKHDYNVLVKREEGLYKDELKTTKTDTKNTLKAHKKALKRLLKTLKKALKPYKKYIRFASKGLRAEKKELNKKHKRALRKYLQKVEDEFEPSLED